MREKLYLLVATLLLPVMSCAEESLYGLTFADRLEWNADEGNVVWDLQGWYGGDYRKFWWKTEGTLSAGRLQEGELQLLYSKATGPYYDLQFGVRVDDFGSGDQVSLAVAAQGDAPYQIEYDASLFLTDAGDLLVRTEFERDLLLTQRWVIQPRVELNFALKDSTERQLDAGLNSMEVGLRLRYEVTRKFAPYLGLEWEREWSPGSTEFSALGGIRFWF